MFWIPEKKLFYKVEARLREEENRVNTYLFPSTITPVQEILYQELIAVHMVEIVTVCDHALQVYKS